MALDCSSPKPEAKSVRESTACSNSRYTFVRLLTQASLHGTKLFSNAILVLFTIQAQTWPCEPMFQLRLSFSFSTFRNTQLFIRTYVPCCLQPSSVDREAADNQCVTSSPPPFHIRPTAVAPLLRPPATSSLAGVNLSSSAGVARRSQAAAEEPRNRRRQAVSQRSGFERASSCATVREVVTEYGKHLQPRLESEPGFAADDNSGNLGAPDSRVRVVLNFRCISSRVRDLHEAI